MGNQSCCLNRPRITQNDEVFKIRTVESQKILQQDKIQIQGISHDAWKVYKDLKTKNYNDQFLNVDKLNPQSHQNKGNLIDRYEKISGYNATFYGEWKHDDPNGKGIALLSNGSLLIGIFHNGYCSGHKCYQIFNNGSYYFGRIQLNVKTGHGKLINNSLQYEGNWLNNLPHGDGMEIYKNGDKYIGNFKEGYKEGNQCIFIWKQNQIYSQYKGSFIKGKIEGEGTLILKNKITIHGKFHQNQIDGTITSQKYKFKGTVKDGQLEKGEIKFMKRNQTYSGIFKNNQLYGECLRKDDKLRQQQCYFFKGKQFKKVVGFTDEQIKDIVKILQRCFLTAQKYNEAIQYLNNQLPNYQSKYIQPYQNIFYGSKYIVVEICQKVLYIKENSQRKSGIISRKNIPQE